MNRSIHLNSNVITFGVPLAIIASMVLLAQSSWFSVNPSALSIGITIDLALTSPLVYLLLIRNKNIPKVTAVPLFIIGIITATYILPSSHQSLLSQLKIWVIPIVEMGVFIFVVSKVRAIYKNYQTTKEVTFDFYNAIQQAVQEILPDKIKTFFAMEIATFYYGFFDWKKRKLSSNEFSYHKESSAVVILSFVIFLIIAETAVFHILLQIWSETAAWILSGLSVYTGLQLFGMTRSLSKRPISIENNQLKLRFGLLGESTIDLENIELVELTSKSIETYENPQTLSPLGDLDSHNVVIHLNNENVLSGIYGIRKSYKTLALHVDNKEKFVEKLKQKKY